MDELKAARAAIDLHVLSVAFRSYVPDFGICETFFSLCAFETPDLPREMVRGVLRDLTDRGLCHYKSGLFTDDGRPAGSGYGLTRKGLVFYLKHSGEKPPVGMGEWWRQQQAYEASQPTV